jgi:hypothetical protein
MDSITYIFGRALPRKSMILKDFKSFVALLLRGAINKGGSHFRQGRHFPFWNCIRNGCRSLQARLPQGYSVCQWKNLHGYRRGFRRGDLVVEVMYALIAGRAQNCLGLCRAAIRNSEEMRLSPPHSHEGSLIARGRKHRQDFLAYRIAPPVNLKQDRRANCPERFRGSM